MMLALLATAGVGSAQQSNPIANPGFETDLRGTWSGTNFNGGQGEVLRVTDCPHSGSACLKIEKTIGPGGIQVVSAMTPVAKDKEYTLSFYYRTTAQVYCAYVASYYQKKPKGGYKPVADVLKQHYGVPYTVLKATEKWTCVERKLKIPADRRVDDMAIRITFQVGARQTASRLYVDDVALQPQEQKKTAISEATAGGSGGNERDFELIYPDPRQLTAAECAAYQPITNAHDMDIKDGLLLRDGKPYFWIGNGSDLGSAQASPAGLWLSRLMGNTFSACEAGAMLGAKQKGNEITFSLYRAHELQGQHSWHREVTRLGLLPELCSPEGPWRWSVLRKLVERNPSLSEIYGRVGHGLSTDINSVAGQKSLEFFRASRLAYSKLIRPLIYELYREPGYEPTNQRIVRAYIDFAKQKYHDLKTANAVWKTSYQDWDEIKPPHFASLSDVAKLNQLRVWLTKNKPEMYFDWLRCLQLDLQEGLKKERRMVKKYLPDVPLSLDVRGHRTYSDGFCTFDPDLLEDVVDLMFIHYQYRPFLYKAAADLDSVNKQMVYPLFAGNYFKTNSRKPIWDCENIVHFTRSPASSMKAMEHNDIGKFHTEPWQFRLDEKKVGKKEKWFAPELDDSSWAKLSVPGCWDKTPEFNGRSGWGWYRKSFFAKANKQDWRDGSKRFYIYGKSITQKAIIWLNGNEIARVHGFEKYQVDVGAILNFNGMNQITIFVDGTGFYNGVREYIHLLADDMICENTVFGETQYRAMLWDYMMLGVSAVSVWNWQNEDHHPYPYLADITDEVNSVSSVVLPAMRRRSGKVGYLYAFLQGRGLLCPSEKSYNDHMSYYNGLVFSQERPDILSEKSFQALSPKECPLVVVPYATFVFDKTYAHFKEYVRDGGTAVVTFGSLERTFSRYAKTDLQELAGIRVLEKYDGAGRLHLGGKAYAIEMGDETASKGVRIAAESATVIATYPDGSAAITEKACGQGRIVFVAPRLDMVGVHALMQNYLPAGEVKIATTQKEEFPFVEGMIAETGERAVLYLHNRGGLTHALTVTIPERFAGYNVRNVTGTFRRIADNTFRIDLPSCTPAALLLEKTGVAPLPVKQANPLRKKIVARLTDLNRDGKGARPKALYLKDNNKLVQVQTGRNLFPYLSDALDQLGYETHSLPITEWTEARLKTYDLVLLPEANSIRLNVFDPKRYPYTERIKQYVQNGGSLLVLCYSGRTTNAGASLLKNLTPAFGVTGGTTFTVAEKESVFGDPLQYVTANISADSALTEGVKEVMLFTSVPLRLKQTPLKPVLYTPRDASVQTNQPMIVAGKYGRGRVVIGSEVMWIQPTRIEYADNARLLINLMGYLVHKPVSPQLRNRFAKTLFLTGETLESIEQK
jgi:uncharacterized membrane protein